MVPVSWGNGAVGIEAFGRRQALFVRRMMLLSVLFHGGMILLGSAISPLFPVAVAPPAVPVELTDDPMSPLPEDPPGSPPAPLLLAKPDATVAAQSAAPRKRESGSAGAHRWLEKLDAGLTEVPQSQVARVTGRTGGIPVRRRGNEPDLRPDDVPPSIRSGNGSGSRLEGRESRLRASVRRGAGVGIESEAAVMFGGTGAPEGDTIPPWIRDMIRRKVRERLPELETAYSEALRREPGLKGKILIRFRIGANGKIERAESMETSVRDASFMEDVLEKVRRWTFEPTDGRTVDVLYPLVFFVPS